jgi:hypothetical protein
MYGSGHKSVTLAFPIDRDYVLNLGFVPLKHKSLIVWIENQYDRSSDLLPMYYLTSKRCRLMTIVEYSRGCNYTGFLSLVLDIIFFEST